LEGGLGQAVGFAAGKSGVTWRVECEIEKV
jgi:hypothetical protein